MESNIQSIKRQLLQLRELHESGALGQAQYDETRATLERRLVDCVLQGEVDEAIASAAAAAAPTAATTQPSAAPTPARPSGLLWAGLALGVVALASAGYFWKGSPAALSGGSAPMVQAEGGGNAGGNAPHTTDTQQIAAMVDKLAQRMKEQPNDAEGWSMLGRSYSVLGRHPEALAAYEKAMALRKDDPDLMVDYADSLAVKNNGSLAGEPIKLVERALKINAKNIKALALAGSFAFEKKDYAGAAKYWDALIKTGPADNPMVQQMRGALDEARRLAGLPPAPEGPLSAPTASQGAAAAPAAEMGKPASGGPSITGSVSLAAALRGKASPDDTVFIYARPATGSRMPLAILRKQVKDLPATFTLDDSLAMSPQSKLSGADKVIVSARVSKSGNAMQQPGDLIGQTEPVKVGVRDLRIEIKDTVSP